MMVSLIKNQILKQLSKFAKNLSPDKVQLSTLKGHCELHNLELDELVLTEVLELPTWLRITRAICNNVMIKIHWTKLKSVPIHLSLDEVLVETETCEDLRPLFSQPIKQTYRGSGKYGFSDRVVDGMTIVVNSVIISFQSPVFQASIQISRLLLESRTPNWKKADLRLSRIKNAERGEILFFKQLDWQVLRIEAKARPKPDGSNVHLTPLRLITNQASCKIAIKKKLADCSVAGCRIVLALDDLLWVLTDAQLVAALHFLNSLSELVQRASELSKKIKAKRKLEQQPEKHSGHTSQPSKSSSSNQRPSSIIRYFNHYDIVETSYHIYCGRIDLHLCDDMDPISGESRKSNVNSGSSLQLSFIKLSADYYPYHRAFGSREHWLRYSEPSSGRSAWVQQLMSLFHENIPAKFQAEATFGTENTATKSSGSKHMSVHRAPPHGNVTSNFTDYQQGEKQSSGKGNADSNGGRRGSISQHKKTSPHWSFKYLMSSCFIFRLEDYSIYKVSNSTTSKKYAQEKFLASDKASLLLPSDMKSVHLEMTSYYFPGDVTLPVPTPNIYLHAGPLQLTYDEGTLIWLNSFMLSLFKCIQKAKNSSSPAVQSFLLSLNIRVEALMPQIVIPADKCYPTHSERPKQLHLQASRIVATNCRVGDHASYLHLNQCLESLSHGGMFFDMSSYPWMKGDFKPIAEKFVEQMIGKQNVDGKKQPAETGHDSLVEGHDMWSIHLDPCWADFTLSKTARSRPQTFIDPSPITLWFFVKAVEEALKSEINSPDVNQNGMLCNGSGGRKGTSDNSPGEENDAKEADIYVLVHVHSLLNVQLTHYQYLFLLRVIDSITALSAQLAEDASAIVEQNDVPNICITGWWPQIELALLLPSLNQNSPTSNSGESLQVDNSVCDDLVPKRKTLSSTYSSYSLGDCDTHTKGFHSRKQDGVTLETPDSSSIPKSHSDLLLNSHSSSSSPPMSPPPLTVAEPSIEKSADHIHKSIHTGTSVMRRGFCNLMASIDSVLTKNETGEMDSISHCDDDTMSVQSDFSSDSDQFVLVGLESSLADDDPFHFHNLQEPDVEEAAEMKEESPSVNSLSDSEKKKEMISVLTLKLSGIEVVAQLSELNTNVLVRCHHTDTDEKVQTSVEDFQNAFSARSRGWQADKISDGPPSEFQLSLRYSKSLAPSNMKSAPSEELLSLSVTDVNLSMLTSSLSGVMDLLKDEISPEPVPARIVVNNLNLLLQDNISLAAEVPVHFHLPGCLIERTRGGHVRLLPLPPGYLQNEICLHASFNENYSLPNVSTSDKRDVKNTIVGTNHLDSITISTNSIDEDINKGYGQEHEKVRKKLSIFQELQRENELLKQELQLLRNAKNDSILQEQLVEAREEVRKLEEGKESLLATIKVLQEELRKQKY